MTTEVENLVKYFSLKQLETVEKEYVDVTENLKEILNLDVENKVKWQLIVREVNHNNNYNFFNPDQVRELNNTGNTEHLDIVCGDFRNTGVEIVVTVTSYSAQEGSEQPLRFGNFFDINLEGEEYFFEGNTIIDLQNAIEELEKLKKNGVVVNGDVKSINTRINNHSYRVDVDENMATVSVYEIFEDKDDKLLNQTYLNFNAIKFIRGNND